MRVIILLLWISIASSSFGQRSFFVKDAINENPIPFAKVFPDYGNPFLTDLDGAFTLNDSVTTVTVKYTGYLDTTVILAFMSDNVIRLKEEIQEFEEVVVTPGVNRAHRIIDQAISNRKKNHPLSDHAFRYKSYSKFLFDINKEAIDSIPDNTTDSSLIRLKEFFTAQHLFVLESASERTFTPPYRDKEEILAYKISGFTDPSLSTFANSLQSFSFYDNQFDILGVKYINPIALGGTKRYLFILEDTTVVGKDTTFTIFYQPRKGKSFNGLSGKLYINTNGFAVEKVTASPYPDTSKTHVNIIQEYEFIDNKKWFPTKLTTTFQIDGVLSIEGVKNSYLEGRGSTYIENIEIDPENMKKEYNDNLVLVTDPDAADLDSTEWKNFRKYDLTDKEKRTYFFMDSVSEENDFDGKLKLLQSLMAGNIPVWKFDIPLISLFNYNLYEKYRLGLGLNTSKRLMKNVILGGYFAYGTGDKVWKYGGKSEFYFSRKRNFYLGLKYHQDVLERGGNDFSINSGSVLDPAGLRQFYIGSMDNQRLAEVALQGDIKANLTLRLSGNYERIWFTNEYHYFPDGDTLAITPSKTDLVETSVELYWSPLEKFMLLGDQKLSMGAKCPKFRLKATKGWNNLLTGDYDYLRLSAQITQHIDLRLMGSLDWCITASKTIGNAPMIVNQVVNGTASNWGVSVMNSFETIKPASFYHTEQAALFLRYTFPAIKTKSDWNEPQFALHHAAGYGLMSRSQDHGLDFQTMEKGYYEAGLILNNIYVSGFTGLGLACFYKYGPYADADWKQNIVPKIAVSFTFN